MRFRRVLVGTAVFLALSCELATRPGRAATPTSIVAEQRRAYLAIVAVGTLSPVPSSPVIARIRTGTTTALPCPVVVAPDGSFHVELTTTKRLLPDAYTFELVTGSTVITSGAFRVGTPAEVEPARELLRKWLTGTRRTLRELVAALERHAHYHQAQAQNASGPLAERIKKVQREAWEAAVRSFGELLLNARMDNALFEREVLLPPFSEAGLAFRELFPEIEARRKVLQDSLANGNGSATLTPSPRILELAERSRKALDLADDKQSWLAGPLGEPEPVWTKATALSGTPGWALDIPDRWRLEDLRTAENDDPNVRAQIRGPAGLEAWIFVRELPEAQDWDELRRIARVLSWEEGGGHSFKIADQPIDLPGKRTFRIFATVDDGVLKRRMIVVIAPPGGRRLVGLTIQIPDAVWPDHQLEIETAAATFRLK